MSSKSFIAMSESYQDTLRMILPPTTNVTPFSPSFEVHKRIEKLLNLLRSLFQLIPNATVPKKNHIYGYVLALRRILSSSSAADVSVDISTDISMTDISFSEQAQHGRLYEYERSIKEMKNKIEHSMTFEDLAGVLGDILQLEPIGDITEEIINDLLTGIKEKVRESVKIKDLVEKLNEELGSNIPSSCKNILQQILQLLSN